MLSFSVNPELISNTYNEGLVEIRGGQVWLHGMAFFIMWVIVLFWSIQIISKGRRVFCIQKLWKSEDGKMNNIPDFSGRVSRNINPFDNWASVLAISTKKQFSLMHTLDFLGLIENIRNIVKWFLI